MSFSDIAVRADSRILNKNEDKWQQKRHYEEQVQAQPSEKRGEFGYQPIAGQ